MTKLTKGEKANFIPNEAGLPCNKKDSQKVAEGLKEWKAIRKEKMTPKGKDISYWKRQSGFPAL